MIYTKTEEMAHLGITFSKTPSKNPKEPEWVGSVLLDGLQLPININMNHWLNWDEHCRLIGRRLGISDWLAVGLFSAGSNAFLPGLRGWVSYEQKQTLLRCIAKDSTEQKGCVT